MTQARAHRRSPGRPSSEDRPETRETLLTTAGRLFAKHGAAEVSLRLLATEAGVTPAMVHYYFGSKDGLYDAMLERTFAEVLAGVRAIAKRSEIDAAERLDAFITVMAGTFLAKPWIPSLVVREVLSEGGRFRERFIEDYATHMATLLPGLLQDEIDEGRLRPHLDPKLGFMSLMGLVLIPFVARPVVERVLGVDYDEAFVQTFADHTRELFLRGAAA